MYTEKINALREEFKGYLRGCLHDITMLDNLYAKFLGRKNGLLSEMMKMLPSLDPESRKDTGKLVNILRQEIEGAINEAKETIKNKCSKTDSIDLTLAERKLFTGSLHPLTAVLEEIKEIFRNLGFQVELGPEIETEFYNFDALNISAHHPARDMQDTFYVEDGVVLRTHTSPVQIRSMLKTKEMPIKMIAPGRVYRNEQISGRSYAYFHQVEGLYIDKGVKFSHLKGILEYFVKNFYAKEAKVRYRPSFFPFTEPSVEVDVSCVICGAKGCSVCKKTGWLEILGAGMVHPNVLISGNIDPKIYTGLAFGIGIERMAMMKYGVNDIRLFNENDIKFLEQF